MGRDIKVNVTRKSDAGGDEESEHEEEIDVHAIGKFLLVSRISHKIPGQTDEPIILKSETQEEQKTEESNILLKEIYINTSSQPAKNQLQQELGEEKTQLKSLILVPLLSQSKTS